MAATKLQRVAPVAASATLWCQNQVPRCLARWGWEQACFEDAGRDNHPVRTVGNRQELFISSSDKIMFYSFAHPYRFLRLLVLALLLTTASLARAGQDDGFVGVFIANADELVATVPDGALTIDVINAVSDSELWHLNVSVKRGPTAQELTQLLIALAAPDEIRNTSSYSTNSRSNNSQSRGNRATKSSSKIKGTAIAVGPVADFDRFVKAIDYGRVLDVDASKWIMSVQVDPKEITRKRLLARAKKTGKRPPGLEIMRDSDDSPLPEGFPTSRLGGLSRHRKRESIAPQLGSQSVLFGKGDEVKVKIAKVDYDAVVEGLDEKDDDDNVYRVKLSDIQSLASAIKKRALRTRLRRAKAYSLLVPEDRLRMIKAAARPSPQGGNATAFATSPANGTAHSPRIWNDKSGKFQVIATYGGIDGQKVRLLKPSGKEALVPLSRLSAADQKYVGEALSSASNGAASATASAHATTQPSPTSRELRSSWSGVRTVRGEEFKRWEFVPPTDRAPLRTVQPAQRSVEFSQPPSSDPFGETLKTLAIARDGSVAIGLMKVGMGRDERSYLQVLDFSLGKAEKMIALPEESVVLDILPKDRLVLLRSDEHGRHKKIRLYVHRIGPQGLEPVSNWAPSKKDDFFRDVKTAWFLAGGRVMTRVYAGPYVIWDRKTAQAIHSIPVGKQADFKIAMDPERRMLAIATDGGISLIDTSSGKHVATVTHDLNEIEAVALSDDLRRVALAGKDSLAAWDLTNGESLFVIPLPTGVTAKTLAWVDDKPLLNGRYLFAPELRVLLWEYTVASQMERSLTKMLGGRLWYAPTSDRGMPLYAASIAIPHAPLLETLDRMGDPDDLLLASPGSKIHVTVETDRGVEIERGLAESVAENLTAAGYECVDHPEGETLVCHIVCKAVGKQEIRVNMSSSPFPDAWDIVTRQVKPYLSYIAISQGETELWKTGWKAEPGHMIFIQKDESLDDALKRLTTPNVEALMQQRFPSHLTRPGTATPAGAYGSSKLTSEGVVQDYFGKE